MKILITYSSTTGNTKKVAEELKKEYSSASLLPIKDVKSIEEFDLIVVGGWIDKGTWNEEVTDFIKTVKQKKVAFFFTIGVFPTVKHGYDSTTKIRELILAGNNEIVNHYHCQGAIAPSIVNMFLTKMKGHPSFEDTKQRYEYAANHPNDEDLFAARYFMQRTIKILEGDSNPHAWTGNKKEV